jgi:hypothetical protein
MQLVATEAEEPWARMAFDRWRRSYPRLERVRPEQADRTANLVLFGTLGSNPLLGALNGTTPVAIEPGGFHVGGRLYDDPAAGMAFIHPSPFAPDRVVVAYFGNTPAGVALTQATPTGGHDFVVVSPPMGVAIQGEFCEDGARRHYYAPYASNEIGEWQQYQTRFLERQTAHHVLHFERGSEAERDIERLAAGAERDVAAVARALGVPVLPRKLTTYYWKDLRTKERLTGREGNAHAIGDVVHMTYGGGIDATGPHEYVHIMANELIGAGPAALLREGLAVMVDGDWNGLPLDAAAAALQRSGKMPPLSRLLCCFRDLDDNVSYPLAGHLVRFVVQRWGMDRFKQLYMARDPEVAFDEIVGTPVDGVERAWIEAIRSPPATGR